MLAHRRRTLPHRRSAPQAIPPTPPPSGRCEGWRTACTTSCRARAWRLASPTRQTWVGARRPPAAAVEYGSTDGGGLGGARDLAPSSLPLLLLPWGLALPPFHLRCPHADTPGYAQENESKPALCRAVNAALGSELFTPDKVRCCCRCRCRCRSHHCLRLCLPARHVPDCGHHHSPQYTMKQRILAGCYLLQVAKALLGGIERGQYHLPSPDLGQNLLVAAMTGLRCLGQAVPPPFGQPGPQAVRTPRPRTHAHHRTHRTETTVVVPDPPCLQPQALPVAFPRAAGPPAAPCHLFPHRRHGPRRPQAQRGARHAAAPLCLVILPEAASISAAGVMPLNGRGMSCLQQCNHLMHAARKMAAACIATWRHLFAMAATHNHPELPVIIEDLFSTRARE